MRVGFRHLLFQGQRHFWIRQDLAGQAGRRLNAKWNFASAIDCRATAPHRVWAMSLSQTEPAPFRLLDHPSYAFFLTARLFATLAVMVEAVTLGWQVYLVARATETVERSAFLVGMVGLVQFAPLFLLTLVAGAVADHFDRRRIGQICAVTEIGLVFVLFQIAQTPHPELGLIFAVAAGFGAVRAFQGPALSALGPSLVPSEVLPRAIAMSSLTWQVGAIFGPWLGGALCGFSSATSYAGAGVCYVVSLLALSFTGPPRVRTPGRGANLAAVKEGLIYVFQNRLVLGAISLDLFAVLLGGATALLPVFARDILHVGSQGFGLLRSAPAIGAATMAFALGRRPLRRKAGIWMFSAVAVFGLATILFAASRILAVSLLALAVLGGADMVSVYVRQTLVQATTPDAMRGRVSAVSGVFIGASNELGEFESGVAARVFGPVLAALLGGVGAVLVTGAWAKLFPELRRADSLIGDEVA